MKTLIFLRFVMVLFEYFIFLVSPEDSSNPDFARRRQTSRFDGRLHGAVKIFFWIGFVMFFWIWVLLFQDSNS